ncbi:hypothetical protein RUM44_013659 [Polyplax serrata]|uniref:Uncharacterized protein n=1 Tax=Polyplax serrata TaxID=468196 RepID=A0ABR1BID0_POLSC
MRKSLKEKASKQVTSDPPEDKNRNSVIGQAITWVPSFLKLILGDSPKSSADGTDRGKSSKSSANGRRRRGRVLLKDESQLPVAGPPAMTAKQCHGDVTPVINQPKTSDN